MNADQAANVRYGRITLSLYLAFNGLLLIVVCAGLWFFAGRANNHGIPPNTSLGFRSQHTLASLHGWYVAQRVGFHFAAVAATIVTVVVFATVAVAFIRRSNPMWLLIIPVIGELAVAGCFMVAGNKADHAAISVETSAAAAAEPMSSRAAVAVPASVGRRSQKLSIVNNGAAVTAGFRKVNCAIVAARLHCR